MPPRKNAPIFWKSDRAGRVLVQHEGALARRAEQGPAVERPPMAGQEDAVAAPEAGPTQKLLQGRQQDVDLDVRVARRPDAAKRQVRRELRGKSGIHGSAPETEVMLLLSRARSQSRSKPMVPV